MFPESGAFLFEPYRRMLLKRFHLPPALANNHRYPA